MSDDLLRVTVSDGKYTFVQREDGSCVALRYGESWREDIFDGLMLGMAHRIEELETKLAKAVEELENMQTVPRSDASQGVLKIMISAALAELKETRHE